MERTTTTSSSAPVSPHDAHQRACWQALWRRLVQPVPPPAERPADPALPADEAR
jgi:hypothetical protein